MSAGFAVSYAEDLYGCRGLPCINVPKGPKGRNTQCPIGLDEFPMKEKGIPVRCGNIGDGKIFILKLQECIRICAGEKGSAATV